MEVAVYKNFRTRGKRPMRNLSLTDKVRAIQRIHDGETKASVSRDLGVPESTLRGWCKNEQKLRFMSSQSQLLEGLADNLPVKNLNAMDTLDNTTNCYDTNLLNEENNNYKIPEFNMDFNANESSLRKFNLNMPFDQANGFSPIPFLPEDTTCTLNTENGHNANNLSLENFLQKQKMCAEGNNFEDIIGKNKANDPYSVMQWWQVFLNSINFMAQASMAAELKLETSTSSSTEPESTSVISSICHGKRTYDDPYSELRNIYELQKGSESDDSLDEDCGMDEDAQPQDLSIKSET